MIEINGVQVPCLRFQYNCCQITLIEVVSRDMKGPVLHGLPNIQRNMRQRACAADQGREWLRQPRLVANSDNLSRLPVLASELCRRAEDVPGGTFEG